MQFFDERQLQNTRAVISGRRKDVCEIYGPYRVSGGFDQSDLGEKGYGRVACTITALTNQNEVSFANGGDRSEQGFEIELAPGVHVSPDCRVFVPARIPEWKRNTAYARRALVVKTDWLKGQTAVFRQEKSGTSGVTEPDWPAKYRAVVADGSLIWRLVGWATVYEIESSNSDETQRTATILRVLKLE